MSCSGARTESTGPSGGRPALLYAAAFVLVLTAAGALLIGIAADAGGPLGLSLATGVAALILLWLGVARSSGPSKGDGQR